MAEHIRRTRVWSGRLRLAHGLLALSVMVLLASGWLIRHAPDTLAQPAADVHGLAGIGLVLGLALRAWLLFLGSGPEHWRALLPQAGDLQRMGQQLVFYATLGRSPLPKWYAHNPLWAPLYALLLPVLALMAATGLAMQSYPVVGTFYLPLVHAFWAPVILVFSGLHLLTAVWHDARGTGADVSAVINGHRIFIVDDTATGAGEQRVSLDGLRSSLAGRRADRS